MRIPWGIAAILVLSANVGNPAAAQSDGPLRIAFKVKDLKGKSLAAKLTTGLKALESVEDCAVSAKSGAVVLVVKAERTLKLSELRSAVKKVGETLAVEEEKLTVAGACSIMTSLTGVAEEVIKALKRVKNVKGARVTEVDGEPQDGQFDIVTKQPKGAKLGAIKKALQKLQDGGTAETPAPVVTDVVWVAPKAAEPTTKPSGHG